MRQDLKEYLQSLIPKDYPDGNALVQEGRELGKKIPRHKNRFLRETGYESWEEYCVDCHKQGKETFQLLVGLSTLEEQVDAIKQIGEFHKRTGFEVRCIEDCPSSLVALPKEYWEGVPKPTSFIMEKEEDWMVQAEAAGVDVCWGDWQLSSPNNLKTTEYAIKAGTSRVDNFSQLIWEFTGYYDEKNRFSDMCRSLGMLAETGVCAGSYPEDGIAGYFMDISSMLGYVMLEHYIIEDLCGAHHVLAYGGLMPDILPRMAFGMACEKLYGGKDKLFLVNYNGSTTTQWNHDIEANYAVGALEMLMEAIINKKYDLAVPHRPVSITEAVRVPTLEELLNISKCGLGAITRAEEWMNFIDFSKFEEMCDLLIEKGEIFYHNMMNAFEEAGINTKDPLELIMILKHIDPNRMEREFHGSIEEFGEFRPYVPSVMFNKTMGMCAKEVENLNAKGYGNMMNGNKVICVSADGHVYGLLLIESIWKQMHADVVNGGTNVEAAEVLDLADEEGTDLIAISLHNGQCLDYAKQIVEVAKRRGKKYRIAMGGVLNSMLPGYTEPVDVSDLINEMGLCASNDFEVQINAFCG